MAAAVEDVHHRHGQDVGVRAADVAEQRQVGRVGSGPRDGERDAEDRVGAELLLVGAAVDGEHLGVDEPLLARLEAEQLRAELLDDRVDGLLDTLAEVAALVAVAPLDRLERPGGRAAGHGGPRERAVVEGDLDLNRGVAARVEDLAGAYCLDAGHAELLGGGGKGSGPSLDPGDAASPRPTRTAGLPRDPAPWRLSADVVALGDHVALRPLWMPWCAGPGPPWPCRSPPRSDRACSRHDASDELGEVGGRAAEQPLGRRELLRGGLEGQQAERGVLLGGRPQLVEGGPVGQHVRVVAEVGVGRARSRCAGPPPSASTWAVTSSRLGQAASGPVVSCDHSGARAPCRARTSRLKATASTCDRVDVEAVAVVGGDQHGRAGPRARGRARARGAARRCRRAACRGRRPAASSPQTRSTRRSALTVVPGVRASAARMLRGLRAGRGTAPCGPSTPVLPSTRTLTRAHDSQRRRRSDSHSGWLPVSRPSRYGVLTRARWQVGAGRGRRADARRGCGRRPRLGGRRTRRRWRCRPRALLRTRARLVCSERPSDSSMIRPRR